MCMYNIRIRCCWWRFFSSFFLFILFCEIEVPTRESYGWWNLTRHWLWQNAEYIFFFCVTQFAVYKYSCCHSPMPYYTVLEHEIEGGAFIWYYMHVYILFHLFVSRPWAWLTLIFEWKMRIENVDGTHPFLVHFIGFLYDVMTLFDFI